MIRGRRENAMWVIASDDPLELWVPHVVAMNLVHYNRVRAAPAKRGWMKDNTSNPRNRPSAWDTWWRLLSSLLESERHGLARACDGVIQFELTRPEESSEFRYLLIRDGAAESRPGISPGATAWIEMSAAGLDRFLGRVEAETDDIRSFGDRGLVDAIFSAIDRTRGRTSWIGVRIPSDGGAQ